MRAWVLLVAAAPLGASAQTSVPPAVIRVVGHGIVRSPPDLATLSLTVRGEGATSDDAMRALVGRKAAIDAALAGKAEIVTGRLAVQAARDKDCDGRDNDGDGKPRLSTGSCAIKGYIAALGITAKVTAVREAGTLLGLVGRLGATDPSLEDFSLSQPAVAQRAAVVDAIRDAREQAQAIAMASNVRLGRLRRVEDQRAGQGGGEDIVVTAAAAPSPAVAPPPIAVSLTPMPIEMRADLIVEFEVGGPAS